MARDIVHSAALIIATGDELSVGEKLDTNSAWLAERLTSLGTRVVGHLTLGDDEAALAQAMTDGAREGVAPVIVTGGLGPTLDDLTRPALARALGERLIEDDSVLAHLDRLMKSRGRALSGLQRLQAQRPVSATMLPNPHGTAPGLFAALQGTDIFCLPGPPLEMKPMFDREVTPRLRPPAGGVIAARVLHTLGMPEAEIGERLGELMQRGRNPSVGTTASGGVVSCRIRYAGDAALAPRELDGAEQRVRASLGAHVFGAEGDTIQSVVVDELRRRGEHLVTAESCTGGLLGSMVTDVPGSSAVYLGGFVTYADEFKSGLIGVDPALIEADGAVSRRVAEAMAAGAIAAASSVMGAQTVSGIHAVAITGIAGPEGGTPGKPVGTVFIAHAFGGAAGASSPAMYARVRRFQFPGGRSDVRDRSAKLALAMLRFDLIGEQPRRLLWETELDGSPPARRPRIT